LAPFIEPVVRRRALELYAEGRRRFVDELGLEPEPELQELQRPNEIVARIPVDGVPSGLAFGFGRLWLALD